MRRNWYTTTGLSVAIASLVLAGCSSATAEKEKVEKVEKVEVETPKPEKPKTEKRGLADREGENSAVSHSTVAAAVTKRQPDMSVM